MFKFIFIEDWHPAHTDEFGQFHEEKFEEYILNCNEIVSITEYFGVKNQCKYCKITCKNETYDVKISLEELRKFFQAALVSTKKDESAE